jgi:hypothetical protein
MEDLFKIKKLYSSIGKIITSSLEFDAIQDSIMEEIHLFFDAENWSLMRFDPNTEELFFVIVKGIDAKAVENIRLGRGKASPVPWPGPESPSSCRTPPATNASATGWTAPPDSRPGRSWRCRSSSATRCTAS